MRGTDAQGQPIRWIPRDPPTGPLPVEKLPTLPGPAVAGRFEATAIPLLNAIRAALIEMGMAREEEQE